MAWSTAARLDLYQDLEAAKNTFGTLMAGLPIARIVQRPDYVTHWIDQ